MRVDLRCYAIVDPEVSGGHELPDLCRMLAAGGATLVQLRDKLSDTRVMVERARAIKAALGRVPLLINDRVDVALAVNAGGVHIGWDDMAPADARALLGPDAIIGLTINSAAARRRDRARPDRLRRHRRRLRHHLEAHQERADRACRHGARDRSVASAQAGFPDLRHRRHQRRQCCAGDRGRR